METPVFSNAVAIGIMAATGGVAADRLDRYLLIGELSLDGTLQPIKGALPIAIAARAQGFEGMILPKQNAAYWMPLKWATGALIQHRLMATKRA